MKKTDVRWLIEDGTFSEDIQPIVKEIRKQGMTAETIRYKPFESGEYNQFRDEDCVIVLGSINLIQQIRKQKPWIPGYFANFHNFDCMIYYAHFAPYLWIKDSYRIMPLNEVKRQFNEMQLKYGRLFFRPCSGMKNFTGQELDYNSLLNHQDNYGKPELPVVIGKYLDISNEFRIFCSGKDIIDGSMYYDYQGNYNTKAISDLEDEDKKASILAMNFAQKILDETNWRPDRIFAMDIGVAETERVGLIEINSFSCSGWYKTNPENVIKKASELAIEEWNEINNI